MTHGQISLTSVGTATVVEFVRKHHTNFVLPTDDIFAVGQDVETDDPVFGLVGEHDEVLESAGERSSRDLGITSAHFAAFEKSIRQEAVACKIKAPFSVSIITRQGICSFPVKRLRKAVSKECH